MATIDRRGVTVDATDTPIAGNPSASLAIKAPCLVATTGNIALSGLQTIDGVALAAGNRVLVWQQTDATTNGIYNASSGNWTRAIDASSNDQWAAGMQVGITAGFTRARAFFQVTSADPIALGTSQIVFQAVVSNLPSGKPLSANSDTNVTLSLGGGFAGALLSTTSISVGWSGTLAVARGGTGGGAPSGALLDNITGFSATGFLTRTGSGTYAFVSAANGIANANLAQAAAWTLKGNPTGGTANVQDFTIDSLTLKSSPTASDEVPIWDAATSSMKKVAISAVGTVGSVASIAGNTGSFTLSHGLKNSGNDLQIDVASLQGYLFGLTLSTAGTSAIFSVAAGAAVDSTAADFMKLTSSMTKTTGAWTAGTGNGALDTGTIAPGTWYHVFAIKNATSGAVDILISASATSPAMPSGYTLFRRIGSMKTDASSHWIAFTQNGDEFWWASPNGGSSTPDISSGSTGTTSLAFGLASVPLGVVVQAIVSLYAFANVAGALNLYIRPLTATDLAPTGGATSPGMSIRDSTNGIGNSGTFRIWTNTSQALALRCSVDATVKGQTLGWVDRRGRDA
jgi:hypothetical protein